MNRPEIEKAGEGALADGSVCLEHRIVRTDGEVRVVQHRLQFVFGERKLLPEGYAGRDDEGEKIGQRFLDRMLRTASEHLEESGGRLVGAVGAVQDITGRKRTEKTLRRSEELYRAVVEQAVEGIFLVDADTKLVLESNVAFQKLLGYTAEELRRMNLYEFVAHDRESVDSNVRRTLQKRKHSIGEQRYRRKDGSLLNVEVNVSAIFYEGRDVLCTLVHDITERRRAEKALQASRANLAEAQRIAHLGSWDYDAVKDRTYWSDEMYRIFGFSPQQFIPRLERFLDSVHPDDRELVREYAANLPREGQQDSIEHRIVRSDGEVRFVQNQRRIERDETGEPIRVTGTVQDITERKRVEEALRHSEERFRSTVQNMSDIVTVLEANGTIRYVSPSIERVLGYAPEERIGNNTFELMHPDDVARAKSLLAEGLQSPGITLSIEVRMRHRDGSWRHIEVSGTNLFGDPGVRGIVLNSRDITERKRAEEELRLKDQAVTASSNSIVITDPNQPDNPIVYVNPAFERSTGYSAEEVIGRNCRFLQGSDRDQPARGELRAAIREGRECRTVMRNYRKDGTLFWNEINIFPVHDENENLINFVGVQNDITERERTEESLRRSLDVLLALREAGQILGSTLESEEIGTRLLEIMRGVSGLTAGVISMPDESGELHVWHGIGFERLWSRARYMPEAWEALHTVLETDEHRLFRLEHPEDPASEPLIGLCLPLRVRSRTVGVLEFYGPEFLAEEDTVGILGSLANQAASALENARLYEELIEREKRLEDLVGKLLMAQEEERRKVAYEVHDGLAQVSAAAHQHLQAFARFHSPASEEGRAVLDRALKLVQQTVGEARRVIGNLRPTALDDFGLRTAIRLEVEALRAEGWRIGYEGTLGDERLPAAVETTLFRVAQEAMMNVRRHANTKRIRLSLDRLGQRVRLSVRDWGRGFDPENPPNSGGPGEKVGLSSMQERVTMLGGKLEIRSRPGVGTLMMAELPLPKQGEAVEEAAIVDER